MGVWAKASSRPRGTEMSQCCPCPLGTPCHLAGGVEPAASHRVPRWDRLHPVTKQWVEVKFANAFGPRADG